MKEHEESENWGKQSSLFNCQHLFKCNHEIWLFLGPCGVCPFCRVGLELLLAWICLASYFHNPSEPHKGKTRDYISTFEGWMFVWHACIIQNLEGLRKSSELREFEVSCIVWYEGRQLKRNRTRKYSRRYWKGSICGDQCQRRKTGERLSLLSSIIMILNPINSKINGVPHLQERDMPLHFTQLSDFLKHFVDALIPPQTLWFLL